MGCGVAKKLLDSVLGRAGKGREAGISRRLHPPRLLLRSLCAGEIGLRVKGLLLPSDLVDAGPLFGYRIFDLAPRQRSRLRRRTLGAHRPGEREQRGGDEKRESQGLYFPKSSGSRFSR